jgi:hypothetical protein
MRFDEQGWAVGILGPLPVDGAFSLLSPEPEARVDAALWAHKAGAFFRARLAVATEKHYPAGSLPITDAAEIDVGPQGGSELTRVLLVTLPIDRAPGVKRAADDAVRAIGGAGFDALVARARRVWQVRERVEGEGDARAPLLLAAVLASVLLAPIVPPGGGAIFGVKGARERLTARGFQS